jgi:hypothetical protein
MLGRPIGGDGSDVRFGSSIGCLPVVELSGSVAASQPDSAVQWRRGSVAAWQRGSVVANQKYVSG